MEVFFLVRRSLKARHSQNFNEEITEKLFPHLMQQIHCKLPQTKEHWKAKRTNEKAEINFDKKEKTVNM